jgi:hypothetical protein
MTSAPVDERDVDRPQDADDEEMPRVVITRERALGFGVFVAGRSPSSTSCCRRSPAALRPRSTTSATASPAGS